MSAFFLAKTFLDLLPIRLLPITLFSVITYAMIGGWLALPAQK